MLLKIGLPLIIAGVAMLMDLRSASVDNGWILFSLTMGFFFQLLSRGIIGIPLYLIGIAFPLGLLAGLFYFRMLGPGDIKVFCALGGILGIQKVGLCMLYALFLGGGISLLLLLIYGDIRQRLHYFWQYVQDYCLTGEVKPYYRKGMTLENFHFTVPIFLSVVLYAGGVY